MTSHRNRPPQTLEELEEALQEDLLFGPIELAVAELERQGFDPASVRARGDEITRRLEERHRLAWRDAARRRLAQARTRDEGVDELPADRPSLLVLIEQARTDPRFRGQIEMKFAGRLPEEADAEELAGLLRDIRLLERLMQEGEEKP